ncbi:NADPH-dependent 7-cyano-7-deazaguanine reductase [Bacteroidia bacterium]|nr:NADPH-dependent 7-cyano-7-deazaguanine reductase [Bacteroidia bacterium]
MEYKTNLLLGKQVEYPQMYTKEVLTAIPRSANRKVYGIEEENRLFVGWDCWHAYEAGFILESGLPVCGVLKIVYSADSPSIVESKSLKLYLGSFNMTRLGSRIEEGIRLFETTVATDLSALLETTVRLRFYQSQPDTLPFDFKDYQILETSCNVADHVNKANQATVIFSVYNEHPAFLQENDNTVQHTGIPAHQLKVGSHLLRSNCKITNQPDWGSIFIHLEANTLPARLSLLKYIVSLRAENHFHEEICEMVFKRLSDLFSPTLLTVSCLYTRRGGIDICPIRSNKAEFLPAYIINENILTERTFRQ